MDRDGSKWARMYEKWERKMLTVALKCQCTRVYTVEFSEYSSGRLEFCMNAFPFQLRRWAFDLAREKGALVRIYDFRRWLDTTDEDFSAMCRGPNGDVASRLRDEYKKTRYMPGYFGKPVYRPVPESVRRYFERDFSIAKEYPGI